VELYTPDPKSTKGSNMKKLLIAAIIATPLQAFAAEKCSMDKAEIIYDAIKTKHPEYDVKIITSQIDMKTATWDETKLPCEITIKLKLSVKKKVKQEVVESFNPWNK
jgi:hypothetical protein